MSVVTVADSESGKKCGIKKKYQGVCSLSGDSFSPVFAAMLLKAAAVWRVFIYPSARLL